MSQSQNKGAIVINRMYAGNYLASNLGHEIINLFQADNGKHYIYLNPKGNFDKTHKDKDTGEDKIKYMLFVKNHSSEEFEVIGLATGLKSVDGVDCTLSRKLSDRNDEVYKKQVEYITEEDITYGGKAILKLFNDAEQQSIFITYEAKEVFIPNKRIFISYNPETKDINTDKLIRIVLKGYNKPSTSLRSYIYPEGTFMGDGTKPTEEVKNKRNSDYQNLVENLINDNLINNSKLWQEQNKKVNPNDAGDGKPREVSLFDICQILDDENRFSNALSYFLTQPQYKELWKDFFKNVNCQNLKEGKKERLNIDVDFGKAYEVTREESAKIEDDSHKKNYGVTGGGRIDLVIRDSNNNIIVIENKIKSDVNTVPNDKKDKTQLNRYVEYVNWLLAKDKEKENIPSHFIILTPNYNIPEISEEMKQYYKIITYGDLYKFLKDRNEVEADANFKAFFEAMHRHTHENVNDYLYYDMLEKFVRRIKEANASKVVSRTDPNNPNQGIVRPEDCQLPEGFETPTGDLISEELGEAIRKSEGY